MSPAQSPPTWRGRGLIRVDHPAGRRRFPIGRFSPKIGRIGSATLSFHTISEPRRVSGVILGEQAHLVRRRTRGPPLLLWPSPRPARDRVVGFSFVVAIVPVLCGSFGGQRIEAISSLAQSFPRVQAEQGDALDCPQLCRPLGP
jgi:hypothetical protein